MSVTVLCAIPFAWIVFVVMFFSRSALRRFVGIDVRKWLFAAYLKCEMGFFDAPENAVGALTARLSEDCNLLPQLGQQLAAVLAIPFPVVVPLILIFFVSDWRLGLFAVPAACLLAFASILYSIIFTLRFKVRYVTFRSNIKCTQTFFFHNAPSS